MPFYYKTVETPTNTPGVKRCLFIRWFDTQQDARTFGGEPAPQELLDVATRHLGLKPHIKQCWVLEEIDEILHDRKKDK